MYVKYPSVKLLNIVIWDEWHALVPRPTDKHENGQGNTQGNNDEEERRSKQDDDDKAERWSKKDNDEGVQWEFHGVEQDKDQEGGQEEQHKNRKGEISEHSYNPYLNAYQYFPHGVGYTWYQ